jgi:hypothetical protein
MRPLKRNARLAISCTVMICALAGAVAIATLTGRASPAGHAGTCCKSARPAVQDRTGVSWITRDAQEPKPLPQRADTTFGSAALRQTSVPFLKLVGGGVVGSPANVHIPLGGNGGHRAHSWWAEGENLRHHRAWHRGPPPRRHGSPPRALPGKQSTTDNNDAGGGSAP